MKRILVTGTTFSVTLKRFQPIRRIADMVGRSLAQVGFGLVTGNPPGVDSVASESFCSECRRLERSVDDAYRQLWLPHLRRGYWLPGRGYPAGEPCLIRLSTFTEWIAEAIKLADAAVMIGGRSGTLTISRRFIDAGKPVFPVPFIGGESRSVFHEILRTWEKAPVPGLSRSQFLRLDVPWIGGTGALQELLLGTLADTADIFISYRRNDSAYAAGRLHADLAEHFGHRRVFMDLHDIAPSESWRDVIRAALDRCKIGMVVIGPRWLEKDDSGQLRLMRNDDVLRAEIATLLAMGKRVVPVLVGGVQLPSEGQLPADLRALTAHQATVMTNANWKTVIRELISSIQKALEST
jgi:hypothetical protein